MAETISDTRKNLTGHVRRFREQGLEAEPVVFGDNRRPDAALLPYETFELLLELAEDIVVAQRVREREAADSGARTSLARVAEELGVDLDEL
jgi:antitoxin StbD